MDAKKILVAMVASTLPAIFAVGAVSPDITSDISVGREETSVKDYLHPIGPTSRQSQDEIAKGARFRYVHWNIGHFARGRKSSTTISPQQSAACADAYRSVIAKLRPDFFGISEFDPVFDMSGRLTTNEVFASFPTRVVGPKNHYQCNAVFSRFPCIRHDVVDYENRKQRTYFVDSVFLFGTNEVHVVQTHLDWRKDTDEIHYAQNQMLQLIDHFKDSPYVIISADFNVWNASEYQPFVDAGYTLANGGLDGCLNTFMTGGRSDVKERLLDNVVVKGFDIKGIFIADYDFYLSDHCIFGCNLEMKTGK